MFPGHTPALKHLRGQFKAYLPNIEDEHKNELSPGYLRLVVHIRGDVLDYAFGEDIPILRFKIFYLKHCMTSKELLLAIDKLLC